ncbi:TonB-dependent receptor [uncultured Bacteroides sp.]|uniref:TonB-dependent receptor n=1 Tax=uncultured Bacteroides sp. TaxID=162156 RepID=UPI002AA7A15D|nr:TonB-dependent receptor [uncultured Bacteroides sp.]
MKDSYASSSTFMRTFFVLLFMIISVQWGFAQLNLNVSHATLGKVIEQIKSQSKYQFFYDDKLAGLSVEDIKVKNVSIEDALNVILKGKDISYKVEDNIIYLSEKDHSPQNTSQQGKERKITGRVVDATGEPLIGVNVLVKGTNTGVITNVDGNFALTIKGTNPVVQFSYIGYKSQEVAVKGQIAINLVMQSDTQMIDEVVVTALGIKRSEKALSYNVQQINTDEITSNKDANFVNSLSGKVAGVNINASSSGVGGVSKVVMRGTKSIMQSSNALYVIDGMPIFSGRAAAGGTEFESQGASEPIADINPEDIESMSVLTGAAAAALYGSEAANGAIVITTKKGKEGKLSLMVNSNTEFMTPFVMPSFQNRYGTGTEGVLSPSGALSWGAPLTKANNYGYSPKDDYFQTGIIGTESISLSTGTEKNQTYASAAIVNSKGIVPNNEYNRYNFAVRNTTSFLNDKMKLDVGANYILQNDRNMTNQGSYNNPLVGAYLFPRGNDWQDIQMYERYDLARKIYTQYWPIGDEAMAMQNPYWINYRNLRENKKDRYMLNAGLTYQILDWLNISGRIRLDNSNNDYTEKFYASTNTQLTEKSSRGLYGITKSQDKQLYADFLININKYFGEDWSLQANIGGSFSDVRSDAMKVRGPIADGSDSFTGEPVGLTNFFAIQNLSASKTQRLQDGWREQTQSVFASTELGYKNTYFLTLTGRNDWPSQLAGPNSKSKSFFYPSIGGSVVLSELIPDLNRDYLSFMKIRGSWASVGSAFERYLANPRYEWNASSGQWSITTQYPLYNLKPERTNSWEMGLSIRFLKNFDFDVTYYNAKTMNQTFNPQLPVSGWSAMYIQTGAVRNSGIELSLGYKKTWERFTWDTGFTFSTNKNKILVLADDVINPATGERFSLNVLNMGGLGEARFLLKEGGSMGDLYSLIDLKRDDNGKILVNQNEQISTETIQNPNNYIKLGSVLPKGNLAWRNNFSWNNFNAGFLVSARLGGVVYSRTQAMLDYYGVSEASANARDLGYVLVNGNDYINPETWYTVVGSGTSIPQYYTYSATNVRLQEVSLGYTFPRKMLHNICDLKVSVIGRNLWMIYNKAPFDPESVASTDNFYQGIDYFIMPSLRNIGFSLSLKF